MRETDAGIIVRGARILATLGPFADEIAVYSPRASMYAEGHSPFALSFAIPCGTTGLKFLCRDSLDQGRSHFDQPLSSAWIASARGPFEAIAAAVCSTLAPLQTRRTSTASCARRSCASARSTYW